jgi:hypothetical protein
MKLKLPDNKLCLLGFLGIVGFVWVQKLYWMSACQPAKWVQQGK